MNKELENLIEQNHIIESDSYFKYLLNKYNIFSNYKNFTHLVQSFYKFIRFYEIEFQNMESVYNFSKLQTIFDKHNMKNDTEYILYNKSYFSKNLIFINIFFIEKDLNKEYLGHYYYKSSNNFKIYLDKKLNQIIVKHKIEDIIMTDIIEDFNWMNNL